MTEDEQSGILAFLQNFYTGVTLYMPFEAEEHPVAAVATQPVVAAPAAAPAPVATAPILAVPTPAVAAPVAPILPMPASRLPSLATVPPSPVVTPVAPAVIATTVATPEPVALPAPAVPEGPGPATDPPVAPYLLTTFATLGSNAQGVVLLVRLSPEQFQKLPRNVFLNKLLQAIQLVMADVVLVNVEGPYPVALSTLRKEIAATHLLAFGKNLLDVAVRTTQIYEPVQFPTVGLSYLAGAEVEMIEYDVSLKKRLWGGLQRMFLG
jgi:hypothetical protein